jgi:hypothetical protein
MFHYLQDHPTSAVLFIHQDPYLVNNLKSGILDCYSNSFTKLTSTVTELQDHSNKKINDTGIRVVPHGTDEFSLEEFPEIAKKQELIKIRKVGFVALLEHAQQYRAKNLYGFHPADPFIIERALDDQDRIYEYATIMGVSSEFAKEELTMVAESIYIDQFRLLTVCNLWKKQINQTTTVEEMTNLLPRMKQSFVSPGIVNV